MTGISQNMFGNQGSGERDRNKVMVLLAMGWTASRIAAAIDVPVATLRKTYGDEIKERDAMRDRLDAERLLHVAEMALAGNVGAHREFQRMSERVMGEVEQRGTAVAAKKLGKKDLAAQRALEVDAELMAELDQTAGVGHVRH